MLIKLWYLLKLECNQTTHFSKMSGKEIRTRTKKNENPKMNEIIFKGKKKANKSTNKNSEYSEDAQFLHPHKQSKNSSKKNIAQNRLKKLRAKIDAEIKVKDKFNKVEIDNLIDKSVVNIKNHAVTSKIKQNPTISKANDVRTFRKNVAADRLKKLKQELQNTIKTTPYTSTEKIPLDNSMEVDMPMDIEFYGEPVETVSNYVNNEKSYLNYDKSCSINDNHSSYHSFDSSQSYFTEEILKIRKEASYTALHDNFVCDVEMKVVIPDGDLSIIVDTNIFFSNLSLIANLVKKPFPPFKSHVVVTPWPVVQEIDHAMKKKSDKLSTQARYANNFINDCLKKKTPRFFGQSLIDFKDNFKNAVSVDDFILQYCLKFVSFHNNVILITNDRNLCSKAMMNHLSVYTAEEFEKCFKFW